MATRGLLLLILILPVGCAVKSPPISLDERVFSTDDRVATIGVLPLEDRRPDEQHAGKKPVLIPLLIWNQRIGDYVTGEEAFTDDVVVSVTNRMANAISGGRFGLAHVVHVDPGDYAADDYPQRYCRNTAMRWIATGTIEDLYGTLHQQWYWLIIPTPWVIGGTWNNNLSDPLGVAKIEMKVYDCEMQKVIFERNLHVSKRYASYTLSQAAKFALEDLMQQLRNETRLPQSLPGAPEAEPESPPAPAFDRPEAPLTPL